MYAWQTSWKISRHSMQQNRWGEPPVMRGRGMNGSPHQRQLRLLGIGQDDLALDGQAGERFARRGLSESFWDTSKFTDPWQN